jgi:hypothetical protein
LLGRLPRDDVVIESRQITGVQALCIRAVAPICQPL